METGGGQTEQNRVDARALGYTPQEVRDIRGGAQQAAAMGQRRSGSGFNFNPLSIIGGAFGNVGRGIGFLLGKGKDWAGKMRGGINPKTNRYYTQQEYEDEKSERIRNKRIQNILGRKAPITDMTQSNLRKLGYTGEMPDVGRSPEMMNMSNLGLYNERVGQPIGPGERIGEYWRGDQGITGTDASMDFAKARRLMTQPSRLPGSDPLLPKADPYQQTSLIDPNTLSVLASSIYESPNEVDNINKRLGYDTSKINWAEQDTIVDDKTPYEGMVTQAGYIPKDLGVGFYGSDSIATGLHKKATTEGVGAKEFGKYIEGAELGPHTNYANKLLKELKLSDKVKSLGDDYVRGLDIKGLGDSYDDQRKAVGTLLKDLKTKKEALKRTDKSWMLDPFASKSSAVREFTSDYSKNKDRLNDLGITTEKEYEDFINKAIGIAHGGRITKALGGRSRDI
jgi:hypothetical protein